MPSTLIENYLDFVTSLSFCYSRVMRIRLIIPSRFFLFCPRRNLNGVYLRSTIYRWAGTSFYSLICLECFSPFRIRSQSFFWHPRFRVSQFNFTMTRPEIPWLQYSFVFFLLFLSSFAILLKSCPWVLNILFANLWFSLGCAWPAKLKLD